MARKTLRGLGALLLAVGMGACNGSPSEPLGGMQTLLEGTLEAHLEQQEGEEDPTLVVEPIEHDVTLAEEGLVRVELVFWQGTEADTGVTQDFGAGVTLGFNIGRVLADGSCDRGSNALLVRDSPAAFRLDAVQYCFTVFAPGTSNGGPNLSDGDVANYQIALTDTQ